MTNEGRMQGGMTLALVLALAERSCSQIAARQGRRVVSSAMHATNFCDRFISKWC
jgi:hypothetical protein